MLLTFRAAWKHAAQRRVRQGLLPTDPTAGHVTVRQCPHGLPMRDRKGGCGCLRHEAKWPGPTRCCGIGLGQHARAEDGQ